MRGKAVGLDHQVDILGSPPRVRGKGNGIQERHDDPGITPAYAGKSCPPQAPTFTRQDHPRVCGEKDKAKEMGATTKGSPPRMRGKACDAVPGLVVRRITPACAGKSPAHPAACPVHRDHPRVCGEKKVVVFPDFPGQGSPPRMRGKGTRPPFLRNGAGITPACAGKRPSLFPLAVS